MKSIQKSRAKHTTPWFSASFPFNPPTQTQPSPQPRRSPPLRPPHVTCGCAWRENSPGNGKNVFRIPGLPSGNLWMSSLLTMMNLSQITRGCMIWCFLKKYYTQRLLGTSLRGFWPSPRGFWPWTLMTRVWDPQEINPTIPQGPGGSNDVQGSVPYPSCGPIHGLVFKCVALVTLDTAAPKVAGAQRTSA